MDGLIRHRGPNSYEREWQFFKRLEGSPHTYSQLQMQYRSLSQQARDMKISRVSCATLQLLWWMGALGKSEKMATKTNGCCLGNLKAAPQKKRCSGERPAASQDVSQKKRRTGSSPDRQDFEPDSHHPVITLVDGLIRHRGPNSYEYE